MKKALILIILGLALLVSACGGAEPTATPVPTPIAAEPTAAPTAIPKPTTETPPAGTGQVTNLQDVRSATIRIQADGTFYDPDGYLYTTQSDGSGFIIDPSGIAITNNHVVGGAGILRVWVGGESKSRNARILGVSECADLAVIDIEGDGYPYLEWYEGDLNVGLPIYAAGFPLGDPEYTLLQGIISKEKADGESDWASVDSVIEHTALTNPGSSGGPIITEDGQVVAVHYAGDPEAEQHFAITRAEALPIIDQLRAGEDVDSIGINPRAVAFEDGLNGIWVTSVKAGSPADQAGIKGGDLITKMAGMTFLTDETLDYYSMADYCDILRTHGPESTIDVKVVRFDTEEVLEGQLNGRPLEATFSFADEGEDDVTNTDESYSEYVKLQDETGAIQIEVPAEWDDVDGSVLTRDDGTPFAASIIAAPDREAYMDFAAPGIEFSAQEIVPGKLTIDQALELFDYYRDKCDYVGREPYSDSLYTGAYDHYTNCAGTDSALFVVVAFPEGESFVNLITIQALTDADLDAGDHALDTFQVVGDLPQAGQGSGDTQPSGDTLALTIGNRTPEPICGIYVVPSDADGWGENLLGSSQMEAGTYWSKEDLDASLTHDLLVKDCTDATLGVRWKMDQNTVVIFGAVSETVNLLFQNETEAAVCELYISPSDSEDWGVDRLDQPATAVTSGKPWRFWLEPGTYDLLARDCEGQDLEQVDEVDLSQDRTWTLEGGGQQGDSGNTFKITVNNQTPQPICGVSIVLAGSEEGDNLLGTATIEPGQSKDFAVDDGAAYDVWANDCDDAYLGATWDVDQPREVTFGGPGRTVNLLVQNNLETTVCEIKISPSDADDWGDDWLQEEGAELRAGRAWRVWLESGTYDMIARDCDGEDLERVDEVDLTFDRSWTLGGGQDGEQSEGGQFLVTVKNESYADICSLKIAPSGSDDWGDNWMGVPSLGPGGTRTYGVDAGGTYDVAAQDCTGAYLGTLWDVEGPETLIIGGPGRTSYLHVQNDLGVDVCEVKISPADSDDWGEDWLQEEGAVITAGTAWRFYLEPGIYDLVARDCQGEDIERAYDVDFAKNQQWVLEP